MSAKKRAKSSKKLTTKSKDLPESVQWLRDFANLGCKPGVLSLKRGYGNAKVKRPPSKPAALKKILFEYDCKAKILSNVDRLTIQKMNEIVAYVDKGIYSRKFLDMNDNEWLETTTGETIYCGKRSDYPLLKEIKNFLLETGISKNGSKNENIGEVWLVAEASLCSMLDAHYLVKTYAQGFVHNYYNLNQIQLPKICVDDKDSLINGLKYEHDGSLIQTTCAYILDFWHNRREFHKYLRQCRCCGKFEFIQGGKWTYCGKDCKRVFDYRSRSDDLISHTEYREDLDKEVRELAYNDIIKCLRERGCTLKEAKEIYKKTKPKNRKSLKEFKRTSYSYKLMVKNSKNRSNSKG